MPPEITPEAYFLVSTRRAFDFMKIDQFIEKLKEMAR
jgi:hypothetical protein